MRYANLVLFIAATVLGATLSVALMWRLPFAIFTITDDNFSSVIKLLEESFGADKFYAIETLKEVVRWGGLINFLTAVVCAILAMMPALATIRLAEVQLFDKPAYRGWKMITWMAGLAALVVAINPIPVHVFCYIMACTLLIGGYIVTYQWPRKHAKKDPLQMPELKRPQRPNPERMSGDMPALQSRETPPHDRPIGQQV